jgi:NTP pyrophosphatase (non-canonical NTP hydrolase)
MALLEIEQTSTVAIARNRMKAVLCGSFRRDPSGLARDYSDLEECCTVLSPADINFVDPEATFVRLPTEIDETEPQVEHRHLDAISSADFVWLHCPDGYVGVSAAMELGHAKALGVPIFASNLPEESVLADGIQVLERPSMVTDDLMVRGQPGKGVERLQRYYKAAAERRGWEAESPSETIGLLRGEIEELVVALDKRAQGVSAAIDPDADVQGELADVQLYVVHLANSLGIDLGDCVSLKEQANVARFDRSSRVG